jgi:Tol biopolymer transport system component
VLARVTVRTTHRRVKAGLAATLAVTFVSHAGASSLFDPALHFRVLATEHFRIHFHQGEDRLAQRLARVAENAWHALERPLGVRPPMLTQVVLVDQTELANGYSTPIPYDTIVLNTVAPEGAEFNADDWLEVAFTHEFTHIVHLDRSEGWAGVVRHVFGRNFVAFPNVLLPEWQIEGLAVYEESVITGNGRLHAGDFRAIVDEAGRHGALEPLDRVNGGLTDWPAGAGWYAYGLGFHQYLADRFGADTLAALADGTARRVPYTASRVFERIYGESLGRLWDDWEASVSARVMTLDATNAGLTRLTHQGFEVSGPRFDRFTCAGCPASVFYSASNADGFPGLYRVSLDGSAPHHVTTRALGSTSAIDRDVVYFDQVEIRRNVGVYSDLYEWSRATGAVRRLTREARLLDPDLSPDGRTIAAVQNHPGQRDLVLLSVASAPGWTSSHGPSVSIATLLTEPDTQYNVPKWSPDGRTIAVERHRLGLPAEIVTVDVASRSVRVIASNPHTRFVTPAWRPDGRAVLAAVAPDDETFNLFEFTIDAPGARQLTQTTGGATWPDVSPDGKTIVFAGYTTDGFDLFSMPYPPAKASAAPTTETAPGERTAGSAIEAPSTAYSPMPTLRPTAWSPAFERDSAQLRLGASATGYDVLGYHGYSVSATWLMSGPAGAVTSGRATPDWSVAYAYGRWRPTWFAAASRTTSFFAGPAAPNGTPSSASLVEREVEAGVVFPIRHELSSHVAQFALARAADDYSLADSTFSRDRTAIKVAWETLTERLYGYSISPEDGVAAGATVEAVRKGLGSSADATTVTADLRAYLPGLGAHHVIAARLAAGASSGDPSVGRTFLLGGGLTNSSVVDFGSGAISLLRGFPSNTFAGSHVALLNLDYRWPIARPERGVGTWPFLLHTVHAALFADAGQAWNRTFNASALKTSVGAELSTNVIVGYYFPFTTAVGTAWGHDSSGAAPGGFTAYFRIGQAF